MTPIAIAAVPTAADATSITWSGKVAGDIINGPPHWADRIHQLLAGNPDGMPSPTEQAELGTLVDIAQVEQLLKTVIGDKSSR